MTQKNPILQEFHPSKIYNLQSKIPRSYRQLATPALKGNQGNLHKSVRTNFVAEESYVEVNKGHGSWEKRTVSICTQLLGVNSWPGLKTLIRVEAMGQFKKGGKAQQETETRY